MILAGRDLSLAWLVMLIKQRAQWELTHLVWNAVTGEFSVDLDEMIFRTRGKMRCFERTLFLIEVSIFPAQIIAPLFAQLQLDMIFFWCEKLSQRD